MKNRTGVYSGLSLFLCFCIASAATPVSALFPKNSAYIVLTVLYLAAFAIPTILLRVMLHTEVKSQHRVCLNISTPKILHFALWASLLVSTAGFLADYLLLQVGTANWISKFTAVPAFAAHGSPLLKLVFFALLIPAMQEIFLRGALFSTYEQTLGTGVCILLSGLLSFALPNVTGNWVGAALTGWLCAYVTYAIGCVWPAVIVQICGCLFRYVMIWIAATYGSLGIWRYFPTLGALLLLLFLYLTSRVLVELLMEKRIAHFQRGHGFKEGAGLFLNPCFAAFLLAFVVKSILKFT